VVESNAASNGRQILEHEEDSSFCSVTRFVDIVLYMTTPSARAKDASRLFIHARIHPSFTGGESDVQHNSCAVFEGSDARRNTRRRRCAERRGSAVDGR
jgi:hypothetical protein